MESTDSFRPSHQSDEKLQPYSRNRAGNATAAGTSNKKKLWIIAPIVILIILIVVLVPVGVHIAKSNNKNSSSDGSQTSSSAAPSATSIPGSAGNTTVSTNSSVPAQANANVPPIDQAFPYGSQVSFVMRHRSTSTGNVIVSILIGTKRTAPRHRSGVLETRRVYAHISAYTHISTLDMRLCHICAYTLLVLCLCTF